MVDLEKRENKQRIELGIDKKLNNRDNDSAEKMMNLWKNEHYNSDTMLELQRIYTRLQVQGTGGATAPERCVKFVYSSIL